MAAGYASAPRRSVAWAAVVAGLATLAITIRFAVLPEIGVAVQACGGRTPSLVRFQLARTVADVQEALGPAGACREAAIVAMDAVNRLDVRAYIATYGAFLLLSLYVLFKEARRRHYWVAALIIVLALVADVNETLRQLWITSDLAGADRHLPVLIVASRAKFIGIGLAALAASWAGWKARPRRYVLAFSCLPALVLLPLALGAPKSYGDLASLALAVAWLALLASVMRVAFRTRRRATLYS